MYKQQVVGGTVCRLVIVCFVFTQCFCKRNAGDDTVSLGQSGSSKSGEVRGNAARHSSGDISSGVQGVSGKPQSGETLLGKLIDGDIKRVIGQVDTSDCSTKDKKDKKACSEKHDDSVNTSPKSQSGEVPSDKLKLINESVKYITVQADPGNHLSEVEEGRLKEQMEYVGFKVKMKYWQYFTDEELSMDAPSFTAMFVSGIRSAEKKDGCYYVTVGFKRKMRLKLDPGGHKVFLLGEDGDEGVAKNPWPSFFASQAYGFLDDKIKVLCGDNDHESVGTMRIPGFPVLDVKITRGLCFLLYLFMAGAVVGENASDIGLVKLKPYGSQVKVLMPCTASINRNVINFDDVPRRYYCAPINIHRFHDRGLVDEAWGAPEDKKMFNIWLYRDMYIDKYGSEDPEVVRFVKCEVEDVHGYNAIARDDANCKLLAQSPRGGNGSDVITEAQFEDRYRNELDEFGLFCSTSAK